MKNGVEFMKKTLKKLAHALPDILFFLSMICWGFSLFFVLNKTIEITTKVDVLTSENTYLKEELDWFKSQWESKIEDITVTSTTSLSSEQSDGGSNVHQ